MNQLLLLSGNPKRRKGRGKRRSAAQRAATARMLAARGNPRKRRSRRGRRSGGAVSRRRRSGGRGLFAGLRRSTGGVMPLLKNGVVGGAGAVGVDIVMGYAQSVLPASMASRMNTDGSMNLMYYAAKGAIAVAIGLYGNRLPVVGQFAGRAAEGALTVMSYEILRGFVPATMNLGYFNPAPTATPRMSGMGKILNVGKIVDIRPQGTGAGTAVAQRLHAMGRMGGR